MSSDRLPQNRHTRRTSRRTVSFGALAVVFVLGFGVALAVRPARADDPPSPTTTTATSTDTVPSSTELQPPTTTAPDPDPAPAPTTTSVKPTAPTSPAPAPEPKPKPQPSQSIPSTRPAPTESSAPSFAPRTHETERPRVSTYTFTRPERKAPAQVRPLVAKPKVQAKPRTRPKIRAHTTAHRQRHITPHKSKHRSATSKSTATRAAPASRLTSVAGREPASDSTSRRALLLLLFGLPALLVGIALLPARALPRGLALSWHDTRLSVGLFGTACLLAAGVIYMLAH